MKEIILAGMGSGREDMTTLGVNKAILNADLVIGAVRLLEDLDDIIQGRTQKAVIARDVMAAIEAAPEKNITVVYSGDTGFYSGSKQLIPLLREKGYSFEVRPGLSSIQLLAAALGESWQDWNLFSAHGRQLDPVGAVMQGKPAFFLTGGELTPEVLCRQLTEAGLGDLPVAVGEQLGTGYQRIIRGSAAELADQTFDSLSVMLIEKASAAEVVTFGPGIPDEKFLRGKVPMTKRDVRAAILARLQPAAGETLWDVGAGTGSVSVEMALATQMGQVYAVETNPEGVELIEQNRRRFGAWNIHVTAGMAPAALSDLPAPDAVFLGGTKGSMLPSIECALSKNPKARFCVTAILLETAMEAIDILQKKGLAVEVTQIQVTEGKPVAGKHMMLANNPVFVISGRWEEPEGECHA